MKVKRHLWITENHHSLSCYKLRVLYLKNAHNALPNAQTSSLEHPSFRQSLYCVLMEMV